MNSPSGHRAEHDELFGAGRDGIGEGSVRRIVGKILFASEETDEGAAFLRDVVSDRSAEHGIARLEGIEDGALGHGTRKVEFHLALDFREVPKVER